MRSIWVTWPRDLIVIDDPVWWQDWLGKKLKRIVATKMVQRFLFFNEREERGRERWLVSGCALISSGWERHILRNFYSARYDMLFFSKFNSFFFFYALCSNRGQTGVNPIKIRFATGIWTLIYYPINSFLQLCHTLKLGISPCSFYVDLDEDVYFWLFRFTEHFRDVIPS